MDSDPQRRPRPPVQRAVLWWAHQYERLPGETKVVAVACLVIPYLVAISILQGLLLGEHPHHDHSSTDADPQATSPAPRATPRTP